MNLKGNKVTVMGLGVHGGGVGTVQWLVGQGAQVTVTDLRSANEMPEAVAAIEKLEDVTMVLGEHREEDFRDADVVVRNPAVPRSSSYLQLARESGAAIEMDSSLFMAHCPSSLVVGVTGSKGKSTTTALLAQVLRAQNESTTLVGSEGTPLLGALSSITEATPVVFEISSWRLEGMAEHRLSPGIAVVTSLYRDHLNTYDSFEEYVETKKAIMRYQAPGDVVLLNRDDELVRQWAVEASSRVLWFSLTPFDKGDGIHVDGESIVVRDGGTAKEILAVADLPRQGELFLQHVMPALLLGYRAGMSGGQMKDALAGWQGLPHRQEVVAEIDGVTYINDSAATIPDAAIAALQSSADKQLIHIVGGNDKELQFVDWAQAESEANVKALLWLPGNATEAMQQAWQAAGGTAESVDVATMDDAIAEAQRLAEAGDVVLLSPGATSFGSFKNEFDRGDKFREAVMKVCGPSTSDH